MSEPSEPLFKYLRRATLDASGLDMGRLAARLDTCRPNLSNVMNGKQSLSTALALRIEREFGLSARELLIRQLDEDLEKARGES